MCCYTLPLHRAVICMYLNHAETIYLWLWVLHSNSSLHWSWKPGRCKPQSPFPGNRKMCITCLVCVWVCACTGEWETDIVLMYPLPVIETKCHISLKQNVYSEYWAGGSWLDKKLAEHKAVIHTKPTRWLFPLSHESKIGFLVSVKLAPNGGNTFKKHMQTLLRAITFNKLSFVCMMLASW